MLNFRAGRAVAALALTALLAAGCEGGRHDRGVAGPGPGGSSAGLWIVAASENKTLQPLLDKFASENGTTVKVDYLGSVDIMMQLQSGSVAYDAVWPAQSLWTALGDRKKLVKDDQSVFWSPVVLAVKKPVAQRLGWVGKPVTVADISKAAQSGGLRFMMSSATQSNSGAAAYLGFLYAFAGKPPVLTSAHLADPAIRGKIKQILGAVNRSAGSSGWLKDLFLQKYDGYDAMVNYEAVAIEANQELVRQGKDPLYMVYPADGLAIADYPLGYVDHQNASKAALYQKLQAYLHSEAAQQEIARLGRRTGPLGEAIQNADPSLFNRDWGVQTGSLVQQVRYPKAEVIAEALDLYQAAFRKPSFTVYCLDVSGSMRGERIDQLKNAMRILLDQDQARRSLLQASTGDVNIVLPFSSQVQTEWSVNGNDRSRLAALRAQVDGLEPGGGTDIYSPVMRALELIKQRADLTKCFPSVILLTDGKSNEGKTGNDLRAHISSQRVGDIPVFSIQFGEASDWQLKEIAELTSGRVFDGKKDLAKAFREAKGYN